MANTSYTPMSFTSGQLLDEDTMNQLANNLEYFKAEAVDGMFTTSGGLVVGAGVKLYGGQRVIAPQTQTSIHVRIPFRRMFSTNCSPIVVTSITSTGQNDFYTVIRGFSQMAPTHEGFQANIRTQNVAKGAAKISKIYFNWIAMGF